MACGCKKPTAMELQAENERVREQAAKTLQRRQEVAAQRRAAASAKR